MKKLKGKAKLQCSTMKNEYYVYDDNYFICGSLSYNKEKLQEMIDRSNKYSELVEQNRNLTAKLEQVFTIANNTIYFNDRSDYLSGLYKIASTVKPDMEEIGIKYIGED